MNYPERKPDKTLILHCEASITLPSCLTIIAYQDFFFFESSPYHVDNLLSV